MTDRYYVDVDEAIIDNETKREYNTWDISGVEEIASLLNEQDKEIKLLQNRFGRAKQRIRRQSKDLDKYFDYFRRELNWDCERILEEVFK